MSNLVHELIQTQLDRWDDCENQPEANLLRLALLRDLVQVVHASKSKYLAQGKKPEAQDMKNWELKLDALKSASSLRGKFFEFVESAPLSKKKRVLPQSLFKHLEREKLERYDRQWECAIASEAAALGWKFWTLDIWVKTSKITEWNQNLADRLWPHGVILFSESATLSPTDCFSTGETESQWHGKWVIILNSHFTHPDELSLNFQLWPGTTEKSPSSPKWELLHS